MKYYKGTSKSDRELSYLSLTRQEEKVIAQVITRLHRKLSDMTSAEQDSIIDLTRRFIKKGNSLTLLQFQDLVPIASKYRIRLPLDDTNLELAQTKDQYGDIQVKRRIDIMEVELQRSVYEGKMSVDSIMKSLLKPTEEEQKVLGVMEPDDFISHLHNVHHDAWVQIEEDVAQQLDPVMKELRLLREEVAQLRAERAAAANSSAAPAGRASETSRPVTQPVSSKQPLPEGRASATSEENAQVKPKAKPKASKQLTAMRERLKARQVAMQ
jgi:hypothetical protein